MTIIHPENPNRLLGRIILVLVALLVAAAVWLGWFYVRLVNLNHNLADIRQEILALETASAEVKDRIFAQFDGEKLNELARTRELVREREPRYIQADEQWFFASHY